MLPNGWCFSTLGEVFTLQAGKNITAKDIKDTATELHPYKCYGGNGVRGFVALYNTGKEIFQSSEGKEHFVVTSILLKKSFMQQSMLLL